ALCEKGGEQLLRLGVDREGDVAADGELLLVGARGVRPEHRPDPLPQGERQLAHQPGERRRALVARHGLPPAGARPRVTVTVRRALPLTSESVTLVPGLRAPMRLPRSVEPCTGLPSTATITSPPFGIRASPSKLMKVLPGLRWASSAGLPGWMFATI